MNGRFVPVSAIAVGWSGPMTECPKPGREKSGLNDREWVGSVATLPVLSRSAALAWCRKFMALLDAGDRITVDFALRDPA